MATHLKSREALTEERVNRIAQIFFMDFLSQNLSSPARASEGTCARVVKNITQDSLKQSVSQIVQEYLRTKQIQPVIQISDKVTQTEIFRSIIKELADRIDRDPPGVREDVERLLLLSGNIQDLDFGMELGYERNSLQTIVTALIQWGESEKAIPFAQGIWDRDKKSMAMREIALALALKNPVKAIEVANGIPNLSLQLATQQEINSQAGVEQNAATQMPEKTSTSSKVLHNIPIPVQRVFAPPRLTPVYDEHDAPLQKKVEDYILWGKSKEAILFASNILAPSTRSSAMIKIVKDLIEKNNLDEAYDIAILEEKIPDASVRSEALENIADAYTKEGNLEKAAQVTRQIPIQGSRKIGAGIIMPTGMPNGRDY